MKLIYPQAPGEPVAVVLLIEDLPPAELGRKYVPAGVPFLFVDDDAIPADRTFRDAWEADFSTPAGYGIGASAWFIEQYRAEIAEVEALPAPEPVPAVTAEPIGHVVYPDFPPLPDDMEAAERAEVEAARKTAYDEAEIAHAAAYEQYLVAVAAENERIAQVNKDAAAAWQAEKAMRIAQLNSLIAVQEQELAA